MPTPTVEDAIRRGGVARMKPADVAAILARPEQGQKLLGALDAKIAEAAQARESVTASVAALAEERRRLDAELAEREAALAAGQAALDANRAANAGLTDGAERCRAAVSHYLGWLETWRAA